MGLAICGHCPSTIAAKDYPKSIAENAEIQPWPHNALWHSFGSNFSALPKNENAVAADMGDSPQMVFRHYKITGYVVFNCFVIQQL